MGAPPESRSAASERERCFSTAETPKMASRWCTCGVGWGAVSLGGGAWRGGARAPHLGEAHEGRRGQRRVDDRVRLGLRRRAHDGVLELQQRVRGRLVVLLERVLGVRGEGGGKLGAVVVLVARDALARAHLVPPLLGHQPAAAAREVGHCSSRQGQQGHTSKEEGGGSGARKRGPTLPPSLAQTHQRPWCAGGQTRRWGALQQRRAPPLRALAHRPQPLPRPGLQRHLRRPPQQQPRLQLRLLLLRWQRGPPPGRRAARTRAWARCRTQ